MLPRLIHPIQTTIERLDRSVMLFDADAREPVHGARDVASDVYILPAQIKIETFKAPSAQAGGTLLASTGYILVRAFDLDIILGVGQRLKLGDHITAMGKITGLDLYITRCDPAAHYPDQLGASLFKCHFEDRSPVQVTG